MRLKRLGEDVQRKLRPFRRVPEQPRPAFADVPRQVLSQLHDEVPEAQAPILADDPRHVLHGLVRVALELVLLELPQPAGHGLLGILRDLVEAPVVRGLVPQLLLFRPLPQLGLIALNLLLDRRVLDGQFLHGRLRGDLLRGRQQAGVDIPHLRAELDAQRLHHVVVDFDHPRPQPAEHAPQGPARRPALGDVRLEPLSEVLMSLRPGLPAHLGVLGIELLPRHPRVPQHLVHVGPQLRVCPFHSAELVQHPEDMVRQLVETRAPVRVLEELDQAHAVWLDRQLGVDSGLGLAFLGQRWFT